MWQALTIVFLVFFAGSSFSNASRFERSLEEQDAELLAGLLSRSAQWECTSNSDCTATNSSCVDGYCACSTGYIFSTDMSACLKVASAFGDECEETLQCTNYLLTGASCTDNACACSTGFHYIHGRCYQSSGLGEECAADVNCYVNADTEATSCVDGICECSDGFYQREYRTCRRAGYAVGDECTVDIDCTFNANAYCSSNVCALDEEEEDQEEETAEEESTRVSTNSLTRATVLVGDTCANNTDCASLGNARCGSLGTCVCNRAHFASSALTECVAELGEECDDDDDVTISNSICRNGTWSCGYGTVFSKNNRICRKTTKQYNFSCLHDEQCYIFGPDSSCNSKRCLCDEGSHWVESELFCWGNKGLGESCLVDQDCYVEGLDVTLTCSSSVCSCPEGSHANSTSNGCKDDVAALGGSCEDDDDCSIANSVCADNVCTCEDNYYELDEGCSAGINATCSADSDCITQNSVCSSELCTCAEDYVSLSIDSCIEVVPYGEECTYDIQCSGFLDNTVCSTTEEDEDTETGTNTTTTVCTCGSNYQYRFDSCLQRKVLGESCTSAGECYVEEDLSRVFCLNGACTCGWDYTQINTTYCRTSGATTILLSTWMGLTVLATFLH